MTAQKGRIFISYRRADSAGYAISIQKNLADYFGEDMIFRDVVGIDPGESFVKVLENEVQSCDVLIALINKAWLNIKDKAGNRRLDNPKDFVRIEIATALKRDIRVIPILFDNTPMPHSADLPDELQPLTDRQAIFVYNQSFDYNVSQLITGIESALRKANESKTFKKKQIQIKHFQKEAEAAIDRNDWKLAHKKLEHILELNPNHIQAQNQLIEVEKFLKERRWEIFSRFKAALTTTVNLNKKRFQIFSLSANKRFKTLFAELSNVRIQKNL